MVRYHIHPALSPSSPERPDGNNEGVDTGERTEALRMHALSFQPPTEWKRGL